MNMSDGRVGVSFGLFGSHIVALPVEVVEPVSNTCWIMVPGQPCREVSFVEYVAEWAEEQVRNKLSPS